MAASFAETIPLVDGVCRAFERRDDIQTVHNIQRAAVDVKKRYAQQQQELKDIIAAYSDKVEKIDTDVTEIEKKVQKSKEKVNEVVKEQENVKRMLADKRVAVDVEASRVQNIQKQVEAARERVESIDDGDDAKVPKIKHSLSLYANISNIRWNFQEKERVKGYLCLQDDDDPLRPFEFKKYEMSQFEITNKLWELME